jgi:hypothetical protein
MTREVAPAMFVILEVAASCESKGIPAISGTSCTTRHRS